MMKSSDRQALLGIALCSTLVIGRGCWFEQNYLFNFTAWGTGVLKSNTLLFLSWNLLLAALPYCFSRLADFTAQGGLIILLLLLCLLFLPNAPYLISDLKHLRPRQGIPFTYDVLTFFCYAVTGLYLGGLAVTNVMRQINWQQWKVKQKAFSLLLFPLVGFGIFLGRVLRWNSWDFLWRPHKVLLSIINSISEPHVQPTVLLFTLGYGIALFICTHLIIRQGLHT